MPSPIPERHMWTTGANSHAGPIQGQQCSTARMELVAMLLLRINYQLDFFSSTAPETLPGRVVECDSPVIRHTFLSPFLKKGTIPRVCDPEALPSMFIQRCCVNQDSPPGPGSHTLTKLDKTSSSGRWLLSPRVSTTRTPAWNSTDNSGATTLVCCFNNVNVEHGPFRGGSLHFSRQVLRPDVSSKPSLYTAKNHF